MALSLHTCLVLSTRNRSGHLNEGIATIGQTGRNSSPQTARKTTLELERMIMRSRWRLTPDRSPVDGSGDERARREACYLRIAARDPGDVELECKHEGEDSGSSVKEHWQKRKPCDHHLGDRGDERDLGADEDESDIEIDIEGDFKSISSDTDFTWL
ncbi:hypothetical protein BJX76DRAFT_331564 [Aspergillus varians]